MLQAQKSCDDLFQYEGFSSVGNESYDDRFDASMFILKPGFETFEKLLKLSIESKGEKHTYNFSK